MTIGLLAQVLIVSYLIGYKTVRYDNSRFFQEIPRRGELQGTFQVGKGQGRGNLQTVRAPGTLLDIHQGPVPVQEMLFQDHPAQRDPAARLAAPLLLLVFRHDDAYRYEKELLGPGGPETVGAPLLRAYPVHAPQDTVRHGEKGRPLQAPRRGRARRGLLRDGPRQGGPRQDSKGTRGERREVQTGKGEPKTVQGTGNGRIEDRGALQEV